MRSRAVPFTSTLDIMSMGLKYFFDVPVYRVDEDSYYRNREEFIEQTLYPGDSKFSSELRRLHETEPRMAEAARTRLAESYGGAWKFNEIVGYIRLHFLGTQVRGEYHGIFKRRIVKTRTKTFEFINWKLVSEVEIPIPITDDGIFGAVLRYIEDCKKELPRRHIDATLLAAVGKHVRWSELFLEK